MRPRQPRVALLRSLVCLFAVPDCDMVIGAIFESTKALFPLLVGGCYLTICDRGIRRFGLGFCSVSLAGGYFVPVW